MSKKWPGKILAKNDGSFIAFGPILRGTKTIIKVKFGADPMIRNTVDRERAALDALKGLAVPKRVAVPRAKIAKFFKDKKFSYVAMEYIPWPGCFAKSFSPAQALGLWAFTVEQMCAFHRKKVLYTDFKHNHLRVSEDLSEARIIDFDACLLVEPKGVYPTEFLGFTPELAAPEFQFSKAHTERVIVYQMGMFLGALLLKYFHNSDINLKSLKKIKAKLTSAHINGIYEILEKCISSRPVDRPQNLEALLTQLLHVKLPQSSYEIWTRLRKPFRRQLSQLGFADPKIPSAKNYFKAS